MRVAKYLMIMLLLFCLSGCVDSVKTGEETSKPAVTSSTLQSSEASEASSTASSVGSDFPPSDWPKESIVTHVEKNGDVLYEEGICSDRFWTPEGIEYLKPSQEIVPTKDKPVVPDKETAIAIATTIFHVQQLVEWDTTNMTVCGVFFDTRDVAWIVAFAENIEDIATGEVTIVLRKDNA